MPARVVDNWIAPPLTAANPAPAPWTQDELHRYLRNGVSRLHGTAAGPMSPVVHGLSVTARLGCGGHCALFRRYRPCALIAGGID